MKQVRSFWAALVGLSLVVVTLHACLVQAGSRFLYFADSRVEMGVNLWLGVAFLRALWAGSASRARPALWIADAGPLRGTRAVAVLAAFGNIWLATSVVVAAGAVPLRMPITVGGVLAIALGLSSCLLAFEWLGAWLAGRPARWRRRARLGLVALAVAWLSRWASNADVRRLLQLDLDAALQRLLSGETWQHFLPARWELALVDGLGAGGGVAAALLPLVALGAAPAAAYVLFGVPAVRRETARQKKESS